MARSIRTVVSTAAFAVGCGLICLVLASCAHEGRRFYSSEPSIVPTVNVTSQDDLNRLAGFGVVTPAYLPEGTNSQPQYTYIPDLKEAELYFPRMPGKPMAVDIYESLDQSHTHCQPYPDVDSAYDETDVLGRE